VEAIGVLALKRGEATLDEIEYACFRGISARVKPFFDSPSIEQE